MGDMSHRDPPESSVEGHRRLMAVMFTDIKDFTVLMESDETTAIGLVKAQREIIRKQIAIHGGEEREIIGDAFLVIFDSAVNAVRCAIDIQGELWEYNQAREADKQVWVRVGIHLGDILIEEGSIYGEGVNLAARVEPLADPGGICITRQVYDQVKHLLDIKVSRLGVKELKNVSEVPDIYRIILAGAVSRKPASIRERLYGITETPLRKAIIASIGLMALVASIWWMFFVSHISYSRQAAFINHSPEPRFSIKASTASKLDHFYKFITKGGRVLRLEEITKPSLLSKDAQEAWEFSLARRPKRNFPIKEYAYDNGQVKEERLFDQFGVLQYKLVYDEGGKVATAHDQSGFVKTFENQIASFGYEEDREGNVLRIENRNAFGMPRSDSSGVAFYRFAPDSNDLTSETSTFDAHGNTIENKEGIAKKKIEYTNNGLIKRETFFDRYGNIREAFSGVAITEHNYDDIGRQTSEVYLNRSGQPVMDEKGACSRIFNYDTQGHLSEITSRSCSGNPKATREGFTTVRYTYNGDRVATESFLDEKGQLVADNRGIATINLSYDRTGRIVSLAFFVTDNKPAVNSDQVHEIRYTYDAQGRPLRRIYLGTDGKPTIAATGYTEVRVQYNDRGEPIEWGYFDTDGNFVNRREGYAVVRNEYDQYGNTISRAFFNKTLEPVMSKEDACHRILMKYDEKGEMEETSCFNNQGKLTPGLKNCAVGKYEYDVYGKITRFECFIDDGILIDVPNLPSILTVKYDEHGYTSEIRAFDASGQPAERYQGAAIWRRISDDYGNQKEIATYDRNGRLIDNPKYKVAIFRREFDERGNQLRVQSFNHEEKPTVGIWGFAEIRFAYDAQNHRAMEAYFDEKGDPTTNWQGVHAYRTAYDDHGRIAQTENLGANGQPAPDASDVAIIGFRYDKWGQLSHMDYKGSDGQPTTNRKISCASQEYINDDRGNVVEIRRFDVNGVLCREQGCIATTHQEFDASGLMVKQLFRDASDNPMLDKDEAAGYIYEYNLQRRRSSEHVIGIDGHDDTDVNGIHEYDFIYRPDRDNAVWYMIFRNPDGTRARSRDGADLRIILYDLIYQERPKARVDMTLAGEIKKIQCLDAAGIAVEGTGCVTIQEAKDEFAKIRPLLAGM